MDGHEYTARFEAPGGKPVLTPYRDTKGIPTVGLGHTGPGVKLGENWSEERCMAAFYNDYSIAEAAAAHVAGTLCWAQLNRPRRAVLIDMSFNMGMTGLSGFKDMLAAIRAFEWKRAKGELLDSQYAKDVKGRATMNASVLLTGLWPQDQVSA